MSLAAIVHRTRNILYGNGMGERPPIRVAAANANESVSGQLVTFTLATGEGTSVKKGDVLAVYDPDTEADAHAVYVTGVSTDTITGVNGYLGSPAIAGADSGDLDAALLEQNPMISGYEIFEAIDTVFATLLWPYVFDVVSATITTPNLVHGQEAVAAEVEEIISAWQIVGPYKEQIEVERHPWDVHTSLSSTGRLSRFCWINGTTGYYLYRAKYAEADEADTELTQLVALGAAAILLGGSIPETSMEASKKPNAEAPQTRGSAADRLWRDFLTLRQQHSEDLGRRLPQQVYRNRG